MPWVWRMDGFQMRPSQHPANGMRPLDHSMQGACDIQISLVICVLLQDVYNNYWLEQHLNLFKENVNFIRWWCNFLEKSLTQKTKTHKIQEPWGYGYFCMVRFFSRLNKPTVFFVCIHEPVAFSRYVLNYCISLSDFSNNWLKLNLGVFADVIWYACRLNQEKGDGAWCPKSSGSQYLQVCVWKQKKPVCLGQFDS